MKKTDSQNQTSVTTGHPKLQLYILIAIFLLAFMLRLIHINQMKENNPFFSHPILDSQIYDDQALQIAGGDLAGKMVFFMGPLYPYFMALIYSIFGHDFYLLFLIQIIIGSFSCVLIYLIAQKIFSRPVAVISAIIAALYGMFIFYDGLIMIETISMFLNLMFVWSLLLFYEKPGGWKIFLAGLWLGLSIIARPNILLVIPLILVWIFMERSRLSPPVKKAGPGVWLFMAVFLLGTGLVISTVTLRNVFVDKDFVLVTSSGGINFYIGNNPQASGTYMDPLGMGQSASTLELESTQKACEIVGRELKPSAVSNFWFGEGLRFIVTKPFDYLKLLGRKLFLLINDYESPVNQNFYFLKQYSGVLQLPLFTFGIICPLALVGMILALKAWRKSFPLYAMIVSYAVALVLFFVLSHYRIPMTALMIIFAGYTVYWLALKIKERKMVRMIPVFILLIGLAILSNWKTTELTFANEYYNLGVVYNQQGLFEKAVDSLNKAAELNPGYPAVYANLGIAYDKLGLSVEAVAAFKKAVELDSARVSVYNNLGNVYLKQGLFAEAVTAFKNAIAKDPGYAFAYYNLGYAYDRQEMTGEAIKAYQKAIDLKPDYTSAHNNLGLIYARQGRLAEAIAQWEEIIRVEPGNVNVQRNIDRARKMLGK
jgi:tetratricopeptide (TPR) repeat protein